MENVIPILGGDKLNKDKAFEHPLTTEEINISKMNTMSTNQTNKQTKVNTGEKNLYQKHPFGPPTMLEMIYENNNEGIMVVSLSLTKRCF